MAPGKKKGKAHRLRALKARQLVKIFEKAGFYVSGQTGSHILMRKEGHPFTLSIPVHSREVRLPIIRNLIDKAGMDREQYFKLLGEL